MGQNNGSFLKFIVLGAIIFIAMCFVLAKLEEKDNQVRRSSTTLNSKGVPSPSEIKDIKPTIQEYKYTPEQLYAEFNANEVKVTHKLSGNKLVLDGEVVNISLFMGKPVIDIAVRSKDDEIKVFFDSNMAGVISQVDVGDYIRVSSYNVSLNPFGSIHLRNSSFLGVRVYSGK